MKKAVRKSLHCLGWDVIRYDQRTSLEAAFGSVLATHRIDTVLDVGANEGQYAKNLRAAGFRGRIISIEPLAAAHSRLMKSAARDPQWLVAPRMALGKQDGTLSMNIAANSYSSSALAMLDAHLRAAPDSVYVGSETVPVRRLDTIAEELPIDAHNIFLKVDVQGFEFQVLEGGPKLLQRIAGVQIELSFVPLYEDQVLFLPLMHYMTGEGFEPWALIPGLIDRSTGRMLQVDGIFFRP